MLRLALGQRKRENPCDIRSRVDRTLHVRYSGRKLSEAVYLTSDELCRRNYRQPMRMDAAGQSAATMERPTFVTCTHFVTCIDPRVRQEAKPMPLMMINDRHTRR